MKWINIIVMLLLSTSLSFAAEEEATVRAKGFGGDRSNAIEDAYRNAVSQAVGTYVSSETSVENFVVVKDAITTRSKGYITDYSIINEGMQTGMYQVEIEATVSLSPLKADAKLLADAIGGVRFLVMYDPRKVKEDEISNYEFAVERVNEQLAQQGYRYIEKNRFDELQREAMNLMEASDTTEMSYIQRLGLKSGAQFIIYLKNIRVDSRSEAFDTRFSSVVKMDVKAYDNCTAEGLGTVSIEGERTSSRELNSTVKDGIASASKNELGELMTLFNSYIGTWVNTGAPFELRFYNLGGFREFRDLRDQLKSDSDFGGQFEITSVPEYTRINCTYKSKPDDLAFKVLDMTDAIPAMKSKKVDVKLIYGRQINFAPQGQNFDKR
jgi:hypothetical protein